jgi:hypothetical protein
MESITGERVQRVSMLSEGRFNDAVKVTARTGESWVVRLSPDRREFPVLRFEGQMLRREALLSDRLSEYGFFPPVTCFDEGSHFKGISLLVRESFPGVNGNLLIAEEPDAAKLVWTRIKEFDSILPALRHLGTGLPENWTLSWSASVFQIVDDFISDISDFNLPCRVPREFLCEIQRHATTLDERPVRLCHGDLWPKNILLERDDVLNGKMVVLDWERAFIGDPSSQWIITERGGGTLFSIDLSTYRTAKKSMPKARSEAADFIYTGMLGIQMIAESIRNDVDVCGAENLLSGALSALREIGLR